MGLTAATRRRLDDTLAERELAADLREVWDDPASGNAAHTAARCRGQLRRWGTPERFARRMEAVRRFKSGESIRSIARALHVATLTVRRDLQRAAPRLLAERPHEQAAAAGEREDRDRRIVAGRAAGLTLKQAAAAAGVTIQRAAQIEETHRATFVDPVTEET